MVVDGVAAAAAAAPATTEIDVEEARAAYALMNSLATSAPQVPIRMVSLDGTIPVRVYEPEGADPGGAVLVWYHGGGWTIGDLESGDQVCRHLATLAGIVVANVDYRLAPEHPFPAAVDDAVGAYAAIRGGALGPHPSAVAVGGDSAGGNLAAVVSLAARDRGLPVPDAQLLVYPVIDGSQEWPSMEENAEGLLLTRDTMRWFFTTYTGSDDTLRRDPLVSPLLAPSHAGLPPAHIVTAEYDPLRDEGEAYRAALAAAGAEVTGRCYPGQVHTFFCIPDIFGPTAMEAVREAAAELRARLT